MMKKKLTLIALFILIWTTGLQAQNALQDADAKYATGLLKKGTKAPDFKLKTPDGKTVQLSKVAKGKYTVLDFWASWCPDCLKDIPNMQRMYKKFAPKGVEFVGISFDTNVDSWKKALDKFNISYTQVSELKKFKDTDISKTYGVSWIPSVYLIDPDGNIVLGSVISDKIEKALTELFPATNVEGTSKEMMIDGGDYQLSAIIEKPLLKAGERCPMVILMHGFGSEKNSFLMKTTAKMLLQKGIASLRFDFSGHGSSEGKFEEMTVPGQIKEAKKVIDYVRQMEDVSSIGLTGHSQGGIVAAMVAGELANEPVIQGIALLAPAGVIREDAIRGYSGGYSFNPLDPPAYLDLWGGLKLGRNYIKTAQRLPIYETAASYKGSALIIHGTADQVVPWSYGERFHHQWRDSRFLLLDSYNHSFSLNPYRVPEEIADYFSEILK